MTRVQAIKTFFEQDGPGAIKGRKVENREIMELTVPERAELGDLAAKALGVELTPTS